ncbi:MAG: 23S rRNA (guanosine(2251)-2'-O)-methyltransferase RlmB [Alphaproteobacteria bacterium]
MKHSHRSHSKGASGSGKSAFSPRRPSGFTAKDEGRFAGKSEGGKRSQGGFNAHSKKDGGFSGKGESYAKKRSFGGKPAFAGKRRDNNRHEKPESVVRGMEKPRDGVLIWGLHAARAAYMNPKRRCFRVWMTDAGEATFKATLAEAKDNLLKRPDAKKVDRNELDRLTPPGSVHQGIVIEVAPLHEPPLHDIIAGDNPPDLLLMLDQVTDPHNVGAILRSAAAFGAGAVIMTERNAPVMTGVQAKSASGATEHVHQIHVVNLARALDELQQAGYWCVGLAEEGEKTIGELDLSGRTVLVMGAEGDGLRQLTRKKCDELARLPTGGPIGSLNVSNAAAVALYEVRRQKSKF